MYVKKNKLKSLVKATGKTMKEFILEDVGMSEAGFYRGIETNTIKIRNIQKAADALGVHIEEIYDFGEEVATTVKEQSGNYSNTNPQNQDLKMISKMFEELQKSLEFYREQLREKDRQINQLLNRSSEELNQSTGTDG